MLIYILIEQLKAEVKDAEANTKQATVANYKH